MVKNLVGAKHVVYDVLSQLDNTQVSANQILQKTGYRKRHTVMSALEYLVKNGYIVRYGTGNGVPYSYKVKNVLDS
jgi:hypothetical protein